MRHNVSGRKLNRTTAHRKMLYRNLVTSLIKHERIQTTVPKAKEARSVAEKLITYAKRGDLHARRIAARKITEPAVLAKLFEEIGPRYAERPGGYTRILRMGPRKGDNAEMAILELVDGTARPTVKDSLKRKRARKIMVAEEKAEAKAALIEEAEERAEAAADAEAPEADADAAAEDQDETETDKDDAGA
ncbi:50S ribosomal protein L17 [bacterium CG17_big_fil_post_rev_8_21_14_2_50_64_8]|nr:MAG: 50S ribosomal protein L17 [bacterium CG17_big_fil_post_rev_8_21_14_2_50_64_8]PJA73777.1 MAG: 50S ribosomal protein L17 [bacterium CG_4_9_14_3_um_filter_65_15]